MENSKLVRVVDYQPCYQHAFRALNVAWIEQYWEMEAADYKSLDSPVENILDKGGFIFIALYNNEPVGTCALIKMNDGGFELAKMAVAESIRGMGIGFKLGERVIEQARQLKAGRVFLESNTILRPAIQLYRKLGFSEIEGEDSPYDRCNIQMELRLQG
ncbi:MAG: GNAT family N-acetyltransferase [Gammaproteobacteria bacterium]